MRPAPRRSIVMVAMTATALIASASPAFGATPAQHQAVVAVGSAPLVPNGARLLRPLADNTQISFDVVLKPRDPAALDAFVQAVSTPGSPQYHQFLAKGEFGPRFGPTPQAIAAVTKQMTDSGLTVQAVEGSVVKVSGASDQVSAALHTTFGEYRLASGELARANGSAPEMPKDVAPFVAAITGLDTLVRLHHAPARPRSLQPQTTPAMQTCLLPGSADDGYYNADQLASYYGFDPLYSASQFGDGITVALIELEPYRASDIDHYQMCYGTSATVTPIVVAGPSAGNGKEATLDIEDIVGLAPGAAIDVYEGVNSFAGITDIYNRIATDNTAEIVSISWGACEADTGASQMQAERAIFQKMASQGQTVFAASGDTGSEACYAQHPTQKQLSAGDPASQPEVTGVGGTDLTDLTGPEVTWNERSNGNGAGGGGISDMWQMPAWQTGLGVTADSDGTRCGAPSGGYCRQVPDVSASADPLHSYPIYWTDPVNGAGWWGIGGTSAAAPTWASLIAVIASGCPSQRFGLINPVLYQLRAIDSSDFNDVTVGNNDYTGTNSNTYQAAVGYDMATGLGTPKGTTLAADLCPATTTDGAGTAAVDKTTVAKSSTNNTLTFTYAAPTGTAMTNGALSIAVPSGWSTPSINATANGYTTASAGAVSVTSSTILVSGVTIAAGDSVSVTYGDRTGGGTGATAPSVRGPNTFAVRSEGTAGGTLTPLASSPTVMVWESATDGTGAVTVSPSSATTGAPTTLTFTYTPKSGTKLSSGEVDVVVPATWTAPQTADSAATGYVTATGGSGADTVDVTGTGPWTIAVSDVSLISPETLTITYGAGGAAAAATAPSTAETSTFSTSQKATAGGTLADLAAQPTVDVHPPVAADGSGTITVSPNDVAAATSTTLTFTYAASGFVSSGEVDVTVPAEWTAPQATTPTSAGYVTASGGAGADNVAVSAGTVKITDVTLNSGDTLTIVYGDTSGGGVGATTPNAVETSPFTTTERSSSDLGSTLKPVATQPSVTVHATTASDGSGTAMVSPTSVTTGAHTTLTFTYTPVVGTILTAGEVDITIPASWTAPQVADSDAAGFVDATGGSGANTPAVAGSGPWTIAVSDVTLDLGDTLVVRYGAGGGAAAAVAPSTAQTSHFTIEQKATNGGTLTELAVTPLPVTVSNPPPPPSGGGGGGGAGGHPQLQRVFGADRIATSIAASKAAFPDANSARVVVIARSDSFADALAGTPLAAKENGPLLLTPTSGLPDTTVTEIGRILPVGSTIYLLGGTAAISVSIESQLSGFGYNVHRLAGSDRYATAVAIAGALGNPTTVFEADGTNFPDALSAGSAAAQQGAAVLLTAGGTMSAATAAYLSAHPSVRYAVGGPAAKADPGASPLVGPDRYATSMLVAETFFPSPLSVGLASGQAFPDALSGGVVAALKNGPMVLVPASGTVPTTTRSYLVAASATAGYAWLFGGTKSVDDDVFQQAADALRPPTA